MADSQDIDTIQQKMVALAERYEELKRADDAALLKYQGITRTATTYLPTPPILRSDTTSIQPTMPFEQNAVFPRPQSAISKSRARTPLKPMASTVAPIIGSVYQPVFELMEQKHTIELRGEISRVYNNKDVFIELTGLDITNAQREDGNYRVHNGLEQLETAGLPRSLLQAAHPTNVSLPFKVFDDKYFAKVKVTDQLILQPFVDSEEPYGYKVGVTVRVVCKTSTWQGWKGNDAGIIFYAQSLEEVVDEPLF